MSILSELKKLTGKQNAKVVSEALPDSIGSGGGVFVFTITQTSEETNPPTFSCDKTHTEIFNAIQNNAVICRIIVIHDGEYITGYSCANVDADSGSATVTNHSGSLVAAYTISGNTVTSRNINSKS